MPASRQPLAGATLSDVERRTVQRFVAMLLVIAVGDGKRHQRLALNLSEKAAIAEGESPFTYSVHVMLDAPEEPTDGDG